MVFEIKIQGGFSAVVASKSGIFSRSDKEMYVCALSHVNAPIYKYHFM